MMKTFINSRKVEDTNHHSSMIFYLLFNDCNYASITIAKTNGVDFSNFTRVSIIFPETTCGFGGLGNVGCRLPDSLISHPYSVTWIPALTFYDTSQVLWGLLAHEEGHNLGLSHSNSLDFGSIPLGAIDYTDSATASANTAINTEYGDPYTIMGGGSYTCGGQYTAFNKRQYLNWLDSGSVTEVTGSGTFVAVPRTEQWCSRTARAARCLDGFLDMAGVPASSGKL